MMDSLDFVDVDRSQQGPQKKGAVYFRLARGEQGRQGSGAGGDPTKNLHVSGYARGTTPDAIRALIAPFVAVHEVVVKPRYMFVNTASVEGASDARSALNGTAFPLNGGPLLIGFAKLQECRFGAACTRRAACNRVHPAPPAYTASGGGGGGGGGGGVGGGGGGGGNAREDDEYLDAAVANVSKLLTMHSEGGVHSSKFKSVYEDVFKTAINLSRLSCTRVGELMNLPKMQEVCRTTDAGTPRACFWPAHTRNAPATRFTFNTVVRVTTPTHATPKPLWRECTSGSSGVFFDVVAGDEAIVIRAFWAAPAGRTANCRRITVHTALGGWEANCRGQDGCGRKGAHKWSDTGGGEVLESAQQARLALNQPLRVEAGQRLGVYLHTPEGGVAFHQQGDLAFDASPVRGEGLMVLTGTYTGSQTPFENIQGCGSRYTTSFAGSVEYELSRPSAFRFR
jgi:hypothetical protein